MLDPVLCRVTSHRVCRRPSPGLGVIHHPDYHPVNRSAEASPETLKLLTISWDQICQRRERVFINLAPVTEPSGT